MGVGVVWGRCMDLNSLALPRIALNGVRKYSVGDACIVSWVDDRSTASGYGLELRNIMLAFSRMPDMDYVLKVHTCSHPFLLVLCLPACLTEKEDRYPFS